MEIIFNKLYCIDNKKTSMEKKYLDDVNLVINKGSIVGFVGENLRIIGDLIMAIKRPSKGEVKLDSLIIKRTSHIDNVLNLRKKVGCVYSSNIDMAIDETVKSLLKKTMKNYGYKPSNITKHMVDSLKIVGLDDSFLNREIKTLSSTEMKKVKLACVISYNPEVIILENFEKGLIYREREYFRKLFLKLKNKFKKTIILITTDLSFLFEIVDKVFVINNGKLVISGDKDIFYEDKLYKYVEMPNIISFTKYAQQEDHHISEYTDIKELIKELYRNVK
ncbi:MAG TPA: ATP-binding cassette domain-containing protein [Candidatus Coprovivens excrementavium]|nr:ATP-binding cassette domain-containing protein [Candidatus Coprovivens excrementavium]